MSRVFSVPAALMGVLIVSAGVVAKGRTTKIEIRSDLIVSPIVITDPSVVKSFNIWNGPGVRVNGEPVHMNPNQQSGAFIDWPRGEVLERPRALQRYEVAFYVECRSAPNDCYIVVYEFDPKAKGGYVYLPGKGDKQVKSNTFLIYHGVEGKWFHSSAEWEKQIRPLIMSGR
ncbi:MAG TPA: hypothetical protein VFV34_11495 [Blastocatellia bacterium]|nr:hypothetical protein [Blastocatellia bacterium]